MIPRVLVALDSHDPAAWQTALAYADKICSAGVGNVVLLVHTKNQLTQTDLAAYIGVAHTKALNRGDPLRLPSGATLRCETLKTLSYFPAETVVIVYWAEMTILDQVDGLKNLAGVIAVPEFPEDARQWEDRWAPIVHGGPVKGPTKPLIDDSTVEKALQALTNRINLSTGLGHPRDKEHAKDIFRILRAYGHQAEQDKIKSWAITRGWQPKDAEELAKLAAKILGQKTKPSLSDHAQDRYRRWL